MTLGKAINIYFAGIRCGCFCGIHLYAAMSLLKTLPPCAEWHIGLQQIPSIVDGQQPASLCPTSSTNLFDFPPSHPVYARWYMASHPVYARWYMASHPVYARWYMASLLSYFLFWCVPYHGFVIALIRWHSENMASSFPPPLDLLVRWCWVMSMLYR